MEILTPSRAKRLKVDEIKELLMQRGLNTTGLKPILLNRLLDAITIEEREQHLTVSPKDVNVFPSKSDWQFLCDLFNGITVLLCATLSLEDPLQRILVFFF